MAAQFAILPVEVVRTCIFAGLIPAEYAWLITEDWERHVENRSPPKPAVFNVPFGFIWGQKKRSFS